MKAQQHDVFARMDNIMAELQRTVEQEAWQRRLEEAMDTVSVVLGGERVCALARKAAELLRVHAEERLATARSQSRTKVRNEPRNRYEGPTDRKAATLPPGMRGYSYTYNGVNIATKSLVPDEGEE